MMDKVGSNKRRGVALEVEEKETSSENRLLRLNLFQTVRPKRLLLKTSEFCLFADNLQKLHRA
ncbi:hypothetical protein RUM43_009441 [Polyplax serrata]|uniref:Uncharacterized protein n=1 Tax=Polyplax serrata TaxID=468196 RepID=A0AAN8P8E2_POLSC